MWYGFAARGSIFVYWPVHFNQKLNLCMWFLAVESALDLRSLYCIDFAIWPSSSLSIFVPSNRRILNKIEIIIIKLSTVLYIGTLRVHHVTSALWAHQILTKIFYRVISVCRINMIFLSQYSVNRSDNKLSICSRCYF